jgi:hypothetical protein
MRENEKKGRGKAGAPTSAEIECPFYRYHSKGRITCEGVIPDTSTTTNFQCRWNNWLTQLRVFCSDKETCQKCEVYMAIWKAKYE